MSPHNGGALAEAVQFDCAYSKTASPDGTQNADFKLKFMLDTTTNKAFTVGNNGLNEVVAVDGSLGLSFLEYLPTGAVQTTTVNKGGTSVHSRHSMMPQKMILSQYYGACRIG